MQYELITDKHREWLKKKLNTTFEEIDNMSEDEEDEFLVQLAFAEADEVCDETEYIDIASEVVDIICGPYDCNDAELENEDDTDILSASAKQPKN